MKAIKYFVVLAVMFYGLTTNATAWASSMDDSPRDVPERRAAEVVSRAPQLHCQMHSSKNEQILKKETQKNNFSLERSTRVDS